MGDPTARRRPPEPAGQPVSDAPDRRPAFLVTIDVEGDDVWARPRKVETRNAVFLPRFQALCERYGFRPTYLTNHEMALSPAFRELARDVLARDAGEIGMHLHAWDSPPHHPLTDDDARHHPYLIEYPFDVMRAKIARLTDLLEASFGVPVISHRAGRWSLDARYARLLLERGYRVDCSVTPHVSWRTTPGDPRGRGGTDYSRFPERAYLVDLEDISRPGTSDLLEVPVTIMPDDPRLYRLALRLGPLGATVQKLSSRLLPARWLRPDGTNLRHLLRLVDRAVAQGRAHVECMLHSSELMPGGSPTFRTAASIETLYRHLEELFAHAAGRFRGATLAEFRAGLLAGDHHGASRAA